MTNCPSLTKLTADTFAITKDLVSELTVSTYDTDPGTVVTVQCQFSFEIVGPSTVTCGSNGQWSGNPSCALPATAAPPDDDSGLDESTILLIILIVVVVFVVAIIVVICIALYYGRRRRLRKEKSKVETTSYYEGDSLPYTNSLSEPYPAETNNVAMYNYYNGDRPYHNDGYRNNDSERTAESYYRPAPDNRNDNYRESRHNRYYRSSDDLHDDKNFRYYDNSGYRHSDTDRGVYYLPYTNDTRDDNLVGKKNYHHYRSYDDLVGDRHFRFHDMHVDEPNENHTKRFKDEDPHYHHFHHHHPQHNAPDRLYEKNPKVSRSPQNKRRRFVAKCPHCSQVADMKHARSADDISTQRDYRKDRQYLRRDTNLWRSMNAIPDNTSWNIPRPYYAD